MAKPWCQGKQYMMGEFGIDETRSSATRTAFYTAAATAVAASSSYCGAFAWAGYDLAPTPASNQFGLFSAPGTLRTDISTAFATLPATR